MRLSISKTDAWDHFAGYACFNEGSVRDYQNRTTQFWPGKSFERSGSMGLSLVTPDEVGDIIVTGSPGGVGRYRKPQFFLEPGMTVEVEITNVGVLQNGVVDEVDAT